ncbi:MAG: DUF47 family protein [Candidatus Heimdallarchaeota archaeon]|nr:DUF47 family protein [Candidatus Heimdallarchaeota archaeon]
MDRERQKSKFLELAGIIEKTGSIYGKMLLSGSPKDKLEEILDLESRGDEIQEELDKDFAQQKNIPYLAIDRAKLLRKMDNILDEFRTATLVYRTYQEFLPNGFTEAIITLSNLITEMSTKLSKAIELIYTSFADSLVIVDEIETLRDKALDDAFGITSSYFKELDESSGWKSYEATSNVVKKSVSCLAAIKDASEVLTLMAYKYD